ncbi:MAG TPA: hypothetical protein VFI00_17755 [Kribbella sp.]|nr:hypothetical protein [Kribbella sp.]
MTGYIVLVVLALAVVAALEISNRRHSTGLTGSEGTWVADDRDVARTKLDLLAIGGAVEPLNHKTASTAGTVHTIRRARLHLHHGRHAA